MVAITQSEWINQAAIAQSQVRETIKQEYQRVTVRRALITCPCGRQRAVVKMYQCLYCKVWFCDQCAEQHFGKTVAQYRSENPILHEG